MKTKNGKQSLIINLNPEEYQIFDSRIKKPITYVMNFEESAEESSMVLQETDQITIRNKQIDFFTPNNVGVLLSISNKALERAKAKYDEYLEPDRNLVELSKASNKVSFLKSISSIICDYIEEIQVSIVFAYSALEAFANLSIPSTYQYIQKVQNKGIDERYDKSAIERWINLPTKLKNILPNIYKTKSLEREKSWSYFMKLEKYRHDIIHQKSIENTSFYKSYFQSDIFLVCMAGNKIIKYFYDNHSLDKSNPLWPWIIGKENDFPVFKADPNLFEVTGNIWDGDKAKI